MRVTAIFGLILVLLGLLVLYVLRGFLVEVITVLLDGVGLVVGFVFIIVGFLLIFGVRLFKKGFSWRLSAIHASDI